MKQIPKMGSVWKVTVVKLLQKIPMKEFTEKNSVTR